MTHKLLRHEQTGVVKRIPAILAGAYESSSQLSSIAQMCGLVCALAAKDIVR